MDTLFYISVLAICIVIFFIGKYVGKKKFLSDNNYSKNEHSLKNSTEKYTSPAFLPVKGTKEVDSENYAADIIKRCRMTYSPKNFVKEVCKDGVLDNDQKIKVLKKIISTIESISYEELFSLADEFPKSFSGKVSEDKVKNTDRKTLSKDDFKTISQYLGMDCLKNIIKNDTFPWEYIRDSWDNAFQKYSYEALGTYFSSNSGKRYWEDAEAKPLLNDLISHLCENETRQPETVSEEFLKAFSAQIELYDLNNRTEINGYVETLEKFAEADIRKFFATAPIAHDENSDDDDENREFDLMMTSPKLFKLWLEETPEIYSDSIFSYLVWNNVLPKRLESDSRWEESLKTLKEYKDEKVPDLSSERYEEVISYVKDISGEEDFLNHFIEKEKYIPLLFWKNQNDDGKWEKMSEDDAMEILDDDGDYINKPYVVYSYIKAGYKLSSEYFSNIIYEDLVQVAKIYFEIHHKAVLSK